ncbi:hypothetical protein L596_024790 [Steinernema carpocapsae]|uniref:Uncharacterized protein n=1 Tax=Steinernema carpocapsae TaxID=34508 RepID=A0A4U5M5S5_STECR|nr:hypothetical protein L596_024790 [Steinernema carpocapsae]
MIENSVCGQDSAYFCVGRFDGQPLVFTDYIGTMDEDVEDVKLAFKGGKHRIQDIDFYIPKFRLRPNDTNVAEFENFNVDLWRGDMIIQLWRGTTCPEGSVFLRAGVKLDDFQDDAERRNTTTMNTERRHEGNKTEKF